MHEFTRLERDLRAALAVFRELGDLTPSSDMAVRLWFSDVPLPDLPLAEMELTDEERHDLTLTVLTEMVDAVSSCPTKDDDEAAFAHLAPILDPLWRELLSLRAPVINAEVSVTQQQLRAMQESFDAPAEELAEMLLSMPIGDAIDASANDSRIRLVLRTLGIIN